VRHEENAERPSYAAAIAAEQNAERPNYAAARPIGKGGAKGAGGEASSKGAGKAAGKGGGKASSKGAGKAGGKGGKGGGKGGVPDGQQAATLAAACFGQARLTPVEELPVRHGFGIVGSVVAHSVMCTRAVSRCVSADAGTVLDLGHRTHTYHEYF